jgi:hypothetical protein
VVKKSVGQLLNVPFMFLISDPSSLSGETHGADARATGLAI